MLRDVLGVLKQFWPLFILQLVLTVLALVDLSRRKHVRYLPKAAWAAISIVVATIGPIVYFVIGRGEE